jgi:hypothetical protein
MTEDMFIIGSFFFTVIALGLGIPIVRALTRRHAQATARTPADDVASERLARIETAIDTLAVEIERISEGQRFVTRLLAERDRAGAALPPGGHESPR